MRRTLHSDVHQREPLELNRRLHAISEGIWLGLFHQLAQIHMLANLGQEYAVDSLPIPVCDNYCIKRSNLYQHKAFRGYIASKKRYFYGLRLHVVVTSFGMPVDIEIAPGSGTDMNAFRRLRLDLPDGATIYAGKAYTDYACEDMLNEGTQLNLMALRRSNSKKRFAHTIAHSVSAGIRAI